MNLRSNRPIFWALLVSGVVHVPLLLLNDEGQRVPLPETVPARAFDLTLVSPVADEVTPKVQDQEPDVEPSHAADDQTSDSTPDPPPHASVPETVAPIRQENRGFALRQAMSNAIEAEVSAGAYAAYRSTECVPAVEAIVSAGIKANACREQLGADAVRSVVADIVAQAALTTGASRSVRRNLDRVEQLLVADSQLEVLVSDDPEISARVREQQRHIREQLALIDGELASVNLLRLIPMARKAAAGLQN